MSPPPVGPAFRPGILTVEPTAGLGNRLRVINSALELAQRLDVPLRIVWTRTTDLNARFDRLFEPIPGCEMLERSWTASRVHRAAGARLSFDPYLTDPDIDRLIADSTLIDVVRRGGRPYLITCRRFLPGSAHLFVLHPVPTIAAWVASATASFDASTVGVHVRGRDNALAAERSPVEAFEAEMDRRVAVDPRTKFFVATDDPEVERRLRVRFDGRVVSLKKSRDRTTAEGAVGAVADMWCLSRTAEILGSYWSSFSEIAAEVGGIPNRVVDIAGEVSSS